MRLIPQPSTGYPVAMTRICAISADGVIHANSSILLLIRRRGKGINHINDKENMCIYICQDSFPVIRIHSNPIC